MFVEVVQGAAQGYGFLAKVPLEPFGADVDSHGAAGQDQGTDEHHRPAHHTPQCRYYCLHHTFLSTHRKPSRFCLDGPLV